MLAGAALAAVSALTAPDPALADKISNPIAVFDGLDKITGRIISFEVAINETVQFGTLQITPRVCYSRPPTDAPQTDAFAQVDEIDEQKQMKRIFSGWMFADSPGLHGIEHPIFDIWLTACKGGTVVIHDAPVEAWRRTRTKVRRPTWAPTQHPPSSRLRPPHKRRKRRSPSLRPSLRRPRPMRSRQRRSSRHPTHHHRLAATHARADLGQSAHPAVAFAKSPRAIGRGGRGATGNGGSLMTAIRTAIKPTRRPGELGVHSVDRFHFAVPDLAVAGNFYGEFGLEVDEDGGHLAMKTRGNPHVWVTLDEGPRKKLGHIAFGAFDDDFDRFAERLQAFGVKRLDPPPGVETNGLWFHDHDGNLVEINVAAKSSPNEKSDFFEVAGGPGVRGAPFRRDVARVTPRRLAHVLLFTRDVEKAVQFYTRTLGLRLSDRSGDGIAFLHGIHGSDHHMIAFVKSSAPGLHHLSWDVGSVDDIGRGAMHMLDKGFARGWGLGRHVLGSNFFHYVGDPWGSFSEYSAGIDFVPADCDWKSGDHAPEEFVLRVGAKSAGRFHPQCRGMRALPLSQ